MEVARALERRAVGDPSIVEVLGVDPSALPRVPADWSRRSDARGALGAGGVLLGLVLLVAAAPLLADRPLLLLPLAALVGAQVHKVTIVLHDCAHQTLFARRALNRGVGGLAAAIVGTDFEEFVRSHLRHHRINGRPEDAEGRRYVPLGDATRRGLVVELVQPLSGVTFLEILRRDTGTGGRRPGALAAAGATQLALAALASGFGRVLWLAPFFAVASATFGLFFSRLRVYCEHLPPPGWGRPFTRTHRTRPWERPLLYALGMNYHLEHHLYPSIPGYRLASVHRVLAHHHTTDSLGSSMTATVLRSLRRR